MTSQIDRIQLNDGTSIPWLAWGNGTGNAKKEALTAGKAVLRAGVNHIDTAQIYGTEKQACQAIQESGLDRSQVYLTSKIYQAHASDDEIRESIDESIAKLGGPPDLFLIHNPYLENEERVVPTWKIMEQYKDAGKLKSLGVSNFRTQDLSKLLKIAKHKPVVNQLEFHPFVLKHLEPLEKIHAEHGIVVESYGPLTPTLRHPTKGEPLKPALQKAAKRLSEKTGEDIDENAVLLLWCKAHNVVAVTASGNADRIRGLAKIAKLKEGLTKEEVSEIDEIGKKYHFRHYSEHMTVDFPDPDLPSQ